jgi:hypothetical protein
MLATILLAIGLRGAIRATPPERQREVGIVLASRQADESVQYFDESDALEEEPERTEDTAQASTADSAHAASAAIPQQVDPASLMAPEIQLPGLALPIGTPDDVVVHDVQLQRGSRRPILPGLDDAAILAEEAAVRAARAARGPTAQVSLFGSADAEGRSFVFAIDRSKSMGGDGLNALAAARDELARALKQLNPKHRFQIIAYHHQAVYFTAPRLTDATPETLSKIPAFFDRLGAFGGTGHEMAVRAALGMEPDVVFLLTDGGDPPLNEIQLKNIRKLAEGLATIHCIQFGFGPLDDEDNFMARLARQNGGSFTYVQM